MLKKQTHGFINTTALSAGSCMMRVQNVSVCQKIKKEARKMTKLTEYKGYDFYIDTSGSTYFNIVPRGSPKPEGGYRNRDYIERIKGIKFPLKAIEELTNSTKAKGVIL
jgi:hypothetical protein